MKDEEMITLSIDDSKNEPPDPYEIFTCEKCGFGTCDRVGRCPKCGYRMMDEEEFEEKDEGKKNGIGFVVFGFIYLIFPAIYLSSGEFGLAELFLKASPGDHLSVTRFTYMFAIPASFIGVGIFIFCCKKDSLWARLGVGGAVMALFIALDLFLFPQLGR